MTKLYKPSAGEHPITPPPELVEKWLSEHYGAVSVEPGTATSHVATKAAQWGADHQLKLDAERINQAWQAGADQELEAWFAAVEVAGYPALAASIRNTRRGPKPPTLKEQALADLGKILTRDRDGYQTINLSNIRRALEQLPNAL